MFTKVFWKDTAERAAWTAAEALIALWLIAGDQALNAFHLDYVEGLGVALGAALISVLKSLIAAKATNGVASTVKEVSYNGPSSEEVA
jgi:hypothetical protein